MSLRCPYNNGKQDENETFRWYFHRADLISIKKICRGKKLHSNFNATALFSLIIKIEGQPLQVKIYKEERRLYLAI